MKTKIVPLVGFLLIMAGTALRFNAEAQGNERLVKRVIAKLVAYLQSIQTGETTASIK